ncbi:MAG TPA: hypothetical protein VFG03_15670 [Telluria sp.]|nr:hypothetical protein [Telluria sp.]
MSSRPFIMTGTITIIAVWNHIGEDFFVTDMPKDKPCLDAQWRW